MSTDVNAVRAANLRHLVEEFAGTTPLAKRLGITPGWISSLIHGHRKITEKTARKFEKLLNLPPRWFDEPKIQGNPASGVDATALRRAVLAVANARRTLGLGTELSAEQTADICVMVYENAIATGVVDEQLAIRLIRLATGAKG